MAIASDKTGSTKHCSPNNKANAVFKEKSKKNSQTVYATLHAILPAERVT